MKKIALLLLVVSAAVLQGCAFSTATLQVAHDQSKQHKGPLGDVDAVQFSGLQLEDNRTDKQRIGWKKNGYGQNTADILSATPVTDIVQNAISHGLVNNNHSVVEKGDVVVTGTVDKFWFETDINFWTVEFTGDLQCSLVFSDGETGEELYSSQYSGSYSEKTAGGLEKTWTEVLVKAVDALIDDLVFDEDLVEALEDR